MNRVPISVIAAFVLILVIAAFWFVFALITALGLNWSFEQTGNFKWTMVGLAFGATAVLAALAVLMGRRHRLAYYLTFAALTLLEVTAFADQMGWLDLVALLVSLSALGLLIKDRRWYLGAWHLKTNRISIKSIGFQPGLDFTSLYNDLKRGSSSCKLMTTTRSPIFTTSTCL